MSGRTPAGSSSRSANLTPKRGYVNGTVVVDVDDVSRLVGRVGFLDDSLKDAVFTQFKTTRLTSDLGTYPTQ